MPDNEAIWRIRPYTANDKEACLALFDSADSRNSVPSEREQFAAYLESLPKDHLLVEDGEGRIVGGGGYVLEGDGETVSLCWGMVGKEWQGRGIGGLLLRNRLKEFCRNPAVRLVRLDATRKGVKFFMNNGFRTYRITRDGYGPRQDRFEMRMVLDDERRRLILSKNEGQPN